MQPVALYLLTVVIDEGIYHLSILYHHLRTYHTSKILTGCSMFSKQAGVLQRKQTLPSAMLFLVYKSQPGMLILIYNVATVGIIDYLKKNNRPPN